MLKWIRARARRGVELGDGGVVVSFMLEPEEAVASPDMTPEIDSSPAASQTATSTRCLRQGALSEEGEWGVGGTG